MYCGLQLLLNDYSVHSDGADFAPLPSDSDWSSPGGSLSASDAESVLGSAVVSEDLSKSQVSSSAASQRPSLSRGSSLSSISSLNRHRSTENLKADCDSPVAMWGAARRVGPADAKRTSAGFAGIVGPATGSTRTLPPRAQLASTSGSGNAPARRRAGPKGRVPTFNYEVVI
jgi:hypothetical protein